MRATPSAAPPAGPRAGPARRRPHADLTGPAAAASPPSGLFTAAHVQLGSSLRFRRRDGAVTALRARVLEQCAGETTRRTATLASDATWLVRGGRVAGRITERVGQLTAYTTLEGRFTSPTTASGTVRQETIVAGAVCDTYKLAWTARRTA